MFGGKHKRGDVNCQTCCCSGPEPCEQDGCDGLMHQDVVDEIEYGDDWSWVHNRKCDKCGHQEYFYDEPRLEVQFEDAE